MPVIGSSRPLSWAIVQAGVSLRSDREFSDVMLRGTSTAVWSAMAPGSWSIDLILQVYMRKIFRICRLSNSTLVLRVELSGSRVVQSVAVKLVEGYNWCRSRLASRMALRVDDQQLASAVGYRSLDDLELELDMISLRGGFAFAVRRDVISRRDPLADRSG